MGRRIGPARWERADRLFARHGGRAVLLGQWVVVARTLVPRLAGMNGVPYRRFAAWHTPSAILWATWMVGASYVLGASYDRLASRVGHASGALAVLVGMITILVLAGRWIGRHPDPVRAFGALLLRPPPVRALLRRAPGPAWLRRAEGRHPVLGLGADLALSVVPLALVAALLAVVIPAMVRFSGLDAVDATVAGWARTEWTSDGYLFALGAASSARPEAFLAAAALLSLPRWWWSWRRQDRRPGRHVVDGLRALGPVLPLAFFVAALDWLVPGAREGRAFAPDGWRAPDSVEFPSPAEFGGDLPTADAIGTLAGHAATETAQLAAAVGLLTWLLARRLPWSLRVTAWTTAAVYVAVCAGSWAYLGWSRTSETVAALVLGAAWTALNAAIWSTRPTGGDPTTAAGRPARGPARLIRAGSAASDQCESFSRTS